MILNATFVKGIKKIDQQLYIDMVEKDFGVEDIDSVHLCSIREKQFDNFYKIKNTLYLRDQVI